MLAVLTFATHQTKVGIPTGGELPTRKSAPQQRGIPRNESLHEYWIIRTSKNFISFLVFGKMRTKFVLPPIPGTIVRSRALPQLALRASPAYIELHTAGERKDKQTFSIALGL